MKLLLFDIDGTLLLTGGVGIIAFEKTFEELYGIPGIWKDNIPDGKTDPRIIQELVQNHFAQSLSEQEYERVREKYLEYFAVEIKRSPKFRLMPGVMELMRGLKGTPKITMGVATGNFEAAAHMKLKQGQLESFFSFGGYGSDSPDRLQLTRKAIERAKRMSNRDFSPQDIYVIGDTVHDIQVAHDLKAHSVAVATGRTSYQTLASRKPTFLWEQFPTPENFRQTLGLDLR